MDERKEIKVFRRGKKNWTTTFSKNFEKTVLLNNETFYWTKYFTWKILLNARRSV